MSQLKEKKSVVLLPTNQKANIGCLVLSQSGDLLTNENPDFEKDRHLFLDQYTIQHLYFFSQEKIKEGDYYLSFFNEDIIKHTNEYIGSIVGCKKIIVSTDPLLNLPSPSESFVKKYVQKYNEGTPITEVMVEYVLNYNNNISIYPNIPQLKVDKNNNITVTAIKDSWTREEVEILLKEVMNLGMNHRQSQLSHYSDKSGNEILKEWVEENL